ncbi:KTSC domain protein [Xylophilus ampelinus]|nr:KTSC domain-containing protein [Variovorax sp.]VTY39798.1 KTSC domain protein [Xylophilus ampelinus]|tara:strand:- start:165 stop:377 length:213 start_codon:yes stop_codon:yes gene_type:complete
MNRDFVPSSTIVSIGYDEPSQTLEVEFKQGAVYQYYNVSQELFDQLLQAPSKGQFLHYNIKNSNPFARVA